MSIDAEGGGIGDVLEIRSSANERFRALQALARSARQRQSQGLALIEGEHLVLGWLDARLGRPREVVLPRRSLGRAALESLCARAGGRVIVLDDALFDRVSQVEHGPGPLLIVSIPAVDCPDAIDDDALYLDGVQDPGNAGTILRSALAFGIRRVIASPDAVGLWSPKVLRAAMGAHFALQIIENVPANRLLAACRRARPSAAEPRAALRVDDADLTVPRVWIFGSEGRGLSDGLASAAAIERLAIPHDDAVESLNVGVAASICLFEQYRQRRC